MDQVSDNWTVFEAAHLLNRAGFGGSPSEIETFHKRGRHGAVDWLLTARESAPPAKPAWSEKETVPLRKRLENDPEFAKLSPAEQEKKSRDLRQELQKENRQNGLSLLGWWVNRMRTTDAPLQEKMTLFWHDHFPSSTQKVRFPSLMLQQNELFRKEALGNFGRLTKEVAQDPAMMIYLDTVQSSKKKPNENFARELLELFTLGEGNYTEEDIKEAARAFTGFQLNRQKGVAHFARRRWDDGEKEILGQRGNFDAQGVVDLVLTKPECSRYLAGKIWEFFGYENPAPELRESLGKSFFEAKL